MKAFLGSLLYVPRPLLTPDALEYYTLPNPAYKQELNHGVFHPKSPEFVLGYQERDLYVGFPPYVEPFLVMVPGTEIEDHRSQGSSLVFKFNAEQAERLRPKLCTEQHNAVTALSSRGHGILVAKPAHGKTLTMIWLMATVGRSAIIFVSSGQLMEQWYKRFTEPDKHGGEPWTDLKPDDICVIGDGDKKYKGEPICIAMLQTTGQSMLEDKAFRNAFGTVVYDECVDLSTPVATPHGEAMIKDLHPGHKLWSINWKKNILEEDIVVAESLKEDEAYEVIVKVQGRNRRIVCSGRHPFFVSGVKVFAEDLVSGVEVLTAT